MSTELQVSSSTEVKSKRSIFDPDPRISTVHLNKVQAELDKTISVFTKDTLPEAIKTGMKLASVLKVPGIIKKKIVLFAVKNLLCRDCTLEEQEEMVELLETVMTTVIDVFAPFVKLALTKSCCK
jgi:hypothetical protein